MVTAAIFFWLGVAKVPKIANIAIIAIVAKVAMIAILAKIAASKNLVLGSGVYEKKWLSSGMKATGV